MKEEEFYMRWPVNKTDHMLQGINAMHEFISLYVSICQNPRDSSGSVKVGDCWLYQCLTDKDNNVTC